MKDSKTCKYTDGSAFYQIFEKPLFNQISSFFDKIFSIYQGGFGKGFCVQHYLDAMFEKCKFCNDEGKSLGTLLTDLSKAFVYFVIY